LLLPEADLASRSRRLLVLWASSASIEERELEDAVGAEAGAVLLQAWFLRGIRSGVGRVTGNPAGCPMVSKLARGLIHWRTSRRGGQVPDSLYSIFVAGRSRFAVVMSSTGGVTP